MRPRSRRNELEHLRIQWNCERGFPSFKMCDAMSGDQQYAVSGRCGGADGGTRRTCGIGCWRRSMAMAVRRAAPLFRVSLSYIYKALIRRRATGDSGPEPESRSSAAQAHSAAGAGAVRPGPGRAGYHAGPPAGLALRSAWGAVEQRRGLVGGEAAGLHVQKKHSRRANRSGRTSPPGGLGGKRLSRLLIPSAWSSSTRPASTPR